MNTQTALSALEAKRAELTPYQTKDSLSSEELEQVEKLVSECDEAEKAYQRASDVEKAMKMHQQKAAELRQPAVSVPGMKGNLDAERDYQALALRDPMALALADPRTGWGKAFVEHDQYKAIQRNPLTHFDVPLEGKALITSSEVLVPSFQPTIVVPSYPPLLLANLFSVVPVSSGIVNSIQETVFTNAADWVAEGALKPESDKTFAPVQVPIQKIAHFIKVTTEALEDTPQIRALIDNNLRGGLLRKLEASLIIGSGTPPVIRGLTNFALPAAPAGTDAYSAIFNGITAVQAAGYTPNGVLMNPTDWAALRMSSSAGGVMFWGPPTDPGQRQIEGVRIVVTASMPAGTAVVGDFTQAIIYQRTALRVFSGLEGRDLVMNIVTVVAEARLALHLAALAAFAEVTIPATP